MDVNPVTPAIGADISGIDLKSPLSNEDADTLRQSLAQYQVLFFRDQFLSIVEQKRLTVVFGPPMRLPYVTALPEEPDVIRVLKEADEGGGVFGGDWHQDFSFLQQPPGGAVLAAVDVPPVGGDTLWISQTQVWETLPEPLKNTLRGRDAIHVGKPYGVKWAPPQTERAGASIKMSRGDATADEERRHPAVIRQPITGREALFLNPLYVLRLDGMSEEESQPILDEIQQHASRPEFACRFRWSAGAVAIWDNLFTQHFAVNDYYGHRRELRRTSFHGSTPRELAV
jgi:taurine dioxygenase